MLNVLGFSTHTETFLPPNSDYFYKNVEIQKAQRTSHYNMFKDLSTLRKTNSSRNGEFNHYALPSVNVYIMTRWNLNVYNLFIKVKQKFATNQLVHFQIGQETSVNSSRQLWCFNFLYQFAGNVEQSSKQDYNSSCGLNKCGIFHRVCAVIFFLDIL